MRHFRCVICNKVNNGAIQTNIGDYLPGTNRRKYVQDYKHPDAYICYECDDAIQECLYEYHIYDMEKLEEDLEKLE